MGKVNALGEQICISGNYNYGMISEKISTKVNVEKLNLGLTDPAPCLYIMLYIVQGCVTLFPSQVTFIRYLITKMKTSQNKE